MRCVVQLVNMDILSVNESTFHSRLPFRVPECPPRHLSGALATGAGQGQRGKVLFAFDEDCKTRFPLSKQTTCCEAEINIERACGNLYRSMAVRFLIHASPARAAGFSSAFRAFSLKAFQLGMMCSSI